MTDLDDLIKKELEKETSEIDELLARDGGLPDMVSGALHGSLRRWVWIAGAITIAATVFFVWAGFNFYHAETVDARIFWGVWLIVGLMVQIALKQWQWMEMNRSSIMREVKRLELTVVTLKRALENKK